MKVPSIKVVRKALVSVNRTVDSECDVRLQVYEDGEWALRWGACSYDQDHSGYWGCGSVPGSNKRFNATSLAKNLLQQCQEAFCMVG